VAGWITVSVIAASKAPADDANPEAQDPLLSTAVSLRDWGLTDPSQVRLGQLSLIHDEPGERLVVYIVRDSLPPGLSETVVSTTPAFDGNSLLVADFASGVSNHLGGYFDAYERAPSEAGAFIAEAPDGRRALRLSYRKANGGFCGAWVHLFDSTRRPDLRRYLDVRPFSTLSFWIRGSRGGLSLRLKLADAEWERKEDAFSVGNVARFLPSERIETRWQRAVVPLDDFPARVDRATLASIVFEAAGEGAGDVFITSLAFSLAPEPLPPLPEPAPAVGERPLGKATWVWNTDDLLDDAARRQDLLRLLVQEGFDRVFLQLPGPPAGPRAPGELEADERLRPLLAELSRANLKVYALDGYAGYALPDYHAGVLQTVENVIRFNRESGEDERFYGIRYDIEPYLLPGFNGHRQEPILQAFLHLVAESARRAREAGLAYGVDIPVWYDTPNEYTYEPVMVKFAGVRKPASQHLIDMVDDLAVMDYRTMTYGLNGTVRHAEGELQYAAATGKPVLIGLETSPLPDEDLFDFVGPPRAGIPSAVPATGLVAMVPSDDSTRVFLLTGNGESAATRLDQLSARIQEQSTSRGDVVWWPVQRRIHVPSHRVSFSKLGAEPLRRVMRETAREFWRYESFAGFALHHAWSYRELLESEQGPPD
jgi:hypothetical protein